MVICGIYKIIINNKVYIGSAKNILRRWREHKKLLHQNLHYNKYLQHAWNKYNFSKIIFEIVEEVQDKSKLIEREQYWMDHYKSYLSENGYNICKKAYSTIGVLPWNKGLHHTEATIQKMKLAHTGKKHTEEDIIKMKLGNPKIHISKMCPCGKLFFGKPSQIRRRKYCSLNCTYKFRPDTWNKGLTKETNIKVLNAAIKNSISHKGHKIGAFTDQHKKNLSISNLGKNAGKIHSISIEQRNLMKKISKNYIRNSFGQFIKRDTHEN